MKDQIYELEQKVIQLSIRIEKLEKVINVYNRQEYCCCGVLRTLAIIRGKNYCSFCGNPIKEN